MKKLLRTAVAIVALLSAGFGLLHIYRIRSHRTLLLAVPKVLAEALSPLLALAGAASVLLGALLHSPTTVAAGLLGAFLSGQYVHKVLARREQHFARAFGSDWEGSIPPRRARMLPRRWTLGLSPAAAPHWERDVPFWIVACGDDGVERPLLCDLWLPPDGLARSGVAFIYLHGSAWHFGSKDMGTRPMFRHLTAQGHVVMDVAYRMCPEVDWQAMAGDPRRAVAWMKANSARYGVDPQRIVLGGGSAGGQLALLTAFAPNHPALTPDDVRASGPEGSDLSVRAVVSWYGPADLCGSRRNAGGPLGQRITPRVRRVLERMREASGASAEYTCIWQLDQTVAEAIVHHLFGGSLAEVPEAYRLFSPAAHVGPHCPPTLLLQGEHDAVVSGEAVRELARRLGAAGVPVVHIEYPQTDHAFDLVLPAVSPVAQAALYEVDRFLALMT